MYELMRVPPTSIQLDPTSALAVEIMWMIRTGSRTVSTGKTAVGLIDIHGKKIFAVSTKAADLLYTGPTAAALAFVQLVGLDKARQAYISERDKN